MTKPGRLILIPSFLADINSEGYLPEDTKRVVSSTKYFLVENVRTSRRFISKLRLDLAIDNLIFETLDKNTDPNDIKNLMAPILEGEDIGVISEAGLPGLADPGNIAISYSHKNNLRVKPLPGASSIQTAISTSGFNGQQFTFHGYIPIASDLRNKFLNNCLKSLREDNYTQVFMEAPYRNQKLLESILKILPENQWLHICADCFGENELIKTLSIEEWKQSIPNIHKIPAVFCLGNYPN